MNEFKKMSRRVLVAFGIVASATGAMAQSSATATGTATANIVRPITIAANVDLAFGNVVPGLAAGTLALAATAGTPAPTLTGGVTQPGTQLGTVTAAKFTVGGEGSFTYTITLPGAAIPLVGPGGSTDMSVDTWTSSIVTTAGALSGAAGGAGTEIFYVGGKLHVDTAANQAPGNYTGSFSVTVAYN